MFRSGIVGLTLAILAGCADDGEPTDGGGPVEFDVDSEHAELLTQDPCARREKGGWHRSIGHCRAMLPPQRVSGVWVTAFEENSFFPDEARVPGPTDPRRFSHELEMDEAAVVRRAGKEPSDTDGEAYLLTFVGRHMRDPYMVDCSGTPHFVTVMDKLVSARHLGSVAPVSSDAFRRHLRTRPVTVGRTHDGRWGDLEDEAVERCTQ